MENRKVLLRVEKLKKYFPVYEGVFKRVAAHVKAVDDVSFEVYEGETLGLVGESGCGKSTLGMSVLRLYNPTAGRVIFDDTDTTHWFMNQFHSYNYIKEYFINRFNALGKQAVDKVPAYDRRYAKAFFDKGNIGLYNELRKDLAAKRKRFRKTTQIVFQDPYSSLNPRMRIRNIIAEGLLTHKMIKRSEINDRVVELLEKVGLSGEYLYRFPHQFSGGQRQRVGIARAIALNPRMIIADEAVSALDVSIQAQILNLMSNLQKELNLTYIFISHDLAVVKHISNRIAVMYLGKIIEISTYDRIFNNAQHPYTISLISANPVPDPDSNKKQIILTGDVPSPLNPPPGCSFHPRCPIADKKRCSQETPPLERVEEGHYVACHFPGKFG